MKSYRGRSRIFPFLAFPLLGALLWAQCYRIESDDRTTGALDKEGGREESKVLEDASLLAEITSERQYDRIAWIEKFKLEDASGLCQILDDTNHVQHWYDILELMAHQPPTLEGTQCIIRYITRWDDFSNLGVVDPARHFYTKITALTLLGIIGDQESIEFLTKLTSEKYIKSAVAEWDRKMITPTQRFKGQKEIIEMIQGHAFIGLVVAQDQHAINNVSQLYTSYKNLYTQSDSMNGLPRDKLYYRIVDALAINDFIKKNGKAQYLVARTRSDWGDVVYTLSKQYALPRAIKYEASE